MGGGGGGGRRGLGCGQQILGSYLQRGQAQGKGFSCGEGRAQGWGLLCFG